MHSLLIIGGTGFFGKSILESFQLGLLKEFNIDSLTVMARNAELLRVTNPYLISNNVNLVNADIQFCTKLPIADIIINAATSSSEESYAFNPEYEIKSIINGVNNFSKIIKKTHRKSKVLYVSSGAVYGRQPENQIHVDEEDSFLSLDRFTSTKRAYAEAKRVAEIYIKDIGSDGCNVSIARCFSFVGKYLPMDKHFAIGNFIYASKYQDCIEVKTNKKVIRSYMHSYDLVDWLLAIACSASPATPIYNVGSDQEISIHELALLISKIYKKKLKSSYIQELDIDRYVPSIKKSFQNLNLSLNYSLNDAISMTYNEI